MSSGSQTRRRKALRLATPDAMRAALWAGRCLRRLRGEHVEDAVRDSVSLPVAPDVGDEAEIGIRAVLRLTNATCLRAAVVRQRWEAAHGREREIVIGVTAPSAGFRAHAWLEGDDACHGEGFEELLRVPKR